MSRGGETRLWAVAGSASLALHAALVVAFALSPAMSRSERPATSIVIESPLRSAEAAAHSTDIQAAVASPESADAAVTSEPSPEAEPIDAAAHTEAVTPDDARQVAALEAPDTAPVVAESHMPDEVAGEALAAVAPSDTTPAASAALIDEAEATVGEHEFDEAQAVSPAGGEAVLALGSAVLAADVADRSFAARPALPAEPASQAAIDEVVPPLAAAAAAATSSDVIGQAAALRPQVSAEALAGPSTLAAGPVPSIVDIPEWTDPAPAADAPPVELWAALELRERATTAVDVQHAAPPAPIASATPSGVQPSVQAAEPAAATAAAAPMAAPSAVTTARAEAGADAPRLPVTVTLPQAAPATTAVTAVSEPTRTQAAVARPSASPAAAQLPATALSPSASSGSAAALPTASLSAAGAATVATAAVPLAPAAAAPRPADEGTATVAAPAERVMSSQPPSVPAAAPPQAPSAAVVEERVAAVIRPEEPRRLMPQQDPAQIYATLLDAIAAESNPGCFMALGSMDGETIGVSGFAAARARMEAFRERLNQIVDAPVAVRGHLVAQSQCAALAFVKGLIDTPEAPLAIELSAEEIASGTELVGRVANLRRPWFYLVVVDDMGRVQEVEDDRLFLIEQGTVGFRTPLTLTGGPVDTVQLLLAISSDEILEIVWLREGAQATTYFEQLLAEIERNGGGVDFGIAAFALR